MAAGHEVASGKGVAAGCAASASGSVMRGSQWWVGSRSRRVCTQRGIALITQREWMGWYGCTAERCVQHRKSGHWNGHQRVVTIVQHRTAGRQDKSMGEQDGTNRRWDLHP